MAPEKLTRVTGEAWRQLSSIYPGLIFNLQFDHEDGAGFWFSFSLVNDDRRQVYAVRHSDLKGV